MRLRRKAHPWSPRRRLVRRVRLARREPPLPTLRDGSPRRHRACVGTNASVALTHIHTSTSRQRHAATFLVIVVAAVGIPFAMTTLASLNDDVLRQIFLYLDWTPAQLAAISLTCRRIYDFVRRDSAVWRVIMEKR